MPRCLKFHFIIPIGPGEGGGGCCVCCSAVLWLWLRITEFWAGRIWIRIRSGPGGGGVCVYCSVVCSSVTLASNYCFLSRSNLDTDEVAQFPIRVQPFWLPLTTQFPQFDAYRQFFNFCFFFFITFLTFLKFLRYHYFQKPYFFYLA